MCSQFAFDRVDDGGGEDGTAASPAAAGSGSGTGIEGVEQAAKIRGTQARARRIVNQNDHSLLHPAADREHPQPNFRTLLTKRLTNSPTPAGRDRIRWTPHHEKCLPNCTRWTQRHPVDEPHNPKVAGSNPAPATKSAKAQVRGPFREIGEGLSLARIALRVCPRPAMHVAFHLASRVEATLESTSGWELDVETASVDTPDLTCALTRGDADVLTPVDDIWGRDLCPSVSPTLVP